MRVKYVCLLGCVYLVLSQRLWSQSVMVSRDCGCVSTALVLRPHCLLSLHPLVGPAQHLFCAVGTGQGRGFLATKGYVTTLYSTFFSLSSFVISLTYPFNSKQKQR